MTCHPRLRPPCTSAACAADLDDIPGMVADARRDAEKATGSGGLNIATWAGITAAQRGHGHMANPFDREGEDALRAAFDHGRTLGMNAELVQELPAPPRAFRPAMPRPARTHASATHEALA